MGGFASYVEAPVEWQGTNVQVCGLWPHIRGVGHPVIGVPIGTGLHTGSAVCCDPLTWFKRGELRNPGAFFLGLTGVGKTTLVSVMALGLAASNVKIIALGDLKPDYVDLTRALGGQVVQLGRGQGTLNMLDPGSMFEIADEFALTRPDVARELRAEAIGRASDLTVTLLQMYRRRPFDADSEQVLRTAVRLLLQREHRRPPVLANLRELITEGPDELRHQTLSFGESDAAYLAETRELQRSLAGFAGSDFGAAFGGDTTTKFDLDGPAVCVDISRLATASSDSRLLDAVLLATWAVGFSGIQAQHTLADHGLKPRGEYMVIMDEIWQVLRTSSGMVERVDAVTRLNRAEGVANCFISHSFADLDSLPLPEDRAKARGFVERSGLVVTGQIADTDLEILSRIRQLSKQEFNDVKSWNAGVSRDPITGEAIPAGRGKFLIKPGGNPGIAVRVHKPAVLAALGDNNRRFSMGGVSR